MKSTREPPYPELLGSAMQHELWFVRCAGQLVPTLVEYDQQGLRGRKVGASCVLPGVAPVCGRSTTPEAAAAELRAILRRHAADPVARYPLPSPAFLEELRTIEDLDGPTLSRLGEETPQRPLAQLVALVRRLYALYGTTRPDPTPDAAPRSEPSQAETACLYVLTRAQRDPGGLGYHLGPGSEAFERLCAVEASLTGETVDVVMARRGKATP